MGELVQQEHPKVGWNRDRVMSTKTCNISEIVQDRTNITMTDRGWNKLWDREGECPRPRFRCNGARLDLCLPPLSDGVTVYGAAEIRGLTNLFAGRTVPTDNFRPI